MTNLRSNVGRLEFSSLHLLLESTDRGPDRRDRLRTTFGLSFSPYRMTAYHIPDPAYVLDLAGDKLVGVDHVFSA